MKKLHIGLILLMTFIGCGDDVDTNSIVGTWNYVATSYNTDSTCTGDGEVIGEGTMTFTDTELTWINIITFENLCSIEGGILIDDTICTFDDYEDTLTLNSFLEACVEQNMFDGFAISDDGDGCININMTNPYTYSDSLYITFTYVSDEGGEEDCSEIGGTFNASNSTCTWIDNEVFDLVIDGNSATFKYQYIDYEYDTYSSEEDCSEIGGTFNASNSTCTYFNGWCDVFVLTKQ